MGKFSFKVMWYEVSVVKMSDFWMPTIGDELLDNSCCKIFVEFE